MPSPEEILDRLVKNNAFPEGFTYPAALDLLEPTLRSLLLSVQGALTEALLLENWNVSGGVAHPPFHVDYMDARVPNALAFQHEGHAFLVITIPMIELLLQTSDRLSRSSSIAHLLDIGPLSSQLTEMLQASLCSIQLNFLVSHEYTHHIHEHVAVAFGPGLAIRKEIQDTATVGGLRDQAQEADADSYAVYIVLTHLFSEGGRAHAMKLFAHRDTSEGANDESLLALFTIAVGAFVYALPPTRLDNTNIYTRQHPPADARMNYIMHSTTSWCNQNRPALEAWMTLKRYQAYMRAVAEATWGTAGTAALSAQHAFLSSAPGMEYMKRLEELRLDEFGIIKRKSEARQISH